MFYLKKVGKSYPLNGANYAILDDLGEIIFLYKTLKGVLNSSFWNNSSSTDCKIDQFYQ